MKLLYIYLLTFATHNLLGANSPPQSYSEYRDLVRGIHRDVVDLISAQDLFGVTNFVILYESPTNYISNAITFIKDKSNPDEAKMIAVYSLQRLPLHEYAQLDADLLVMANQGVLPPTLVNHALFPGSEWNSKLEFNYQREEVQKLLAKLLASNVIDKTNKEYIKDILSGKAKADIEELEESGMLPKRR